MEIRKIKFFLIAVIISSSALAQDDLLDMLEDEVGEETMEVAYTFKSTRIINSHSIERMKKNQLDFRINHRFGEVNLGAYDLWGLDQSLVSFDFGYGINDRLMIGFRRSTFEKTYDGSLKFTLMRQTTGSKTFPVAISYYTNMGIVSLKDNMLDSAFTNRLSYTHQLLVARKFNEALSVQIMPTYVHRNLVDFDEENDIIAIGIGGRYKFARRVAFMYEFFWTSQGEFYNVEQDASNSVTYHPVSLGFDIETGGHVFQLFFTNARIMEEAGFLSETTGNPLKGGLFFGFNISRVFAIGGNAHQ